MVFCYSTNIHCGSHWGPAFVGGMCGPVCLCLGALETGLRSWLSCLVTVQLGRVTSLRLIFLCLGKTGCPENESDSSWKKNCVPSWVTENAEEVGSFIYFCSTDIAVAGVAPWVDDLSAFFLPPSATWDLTVPKNFRWVGISLVFLCISKALPFTCALNMYF